MHTTRSSDSRRSDTSGSSRAPLGNDILQAPHQRWRRHERIHFLLYSPATDGIVTIEQTEDGALCCLVYLNWRSGDVVDLDDGQPEPPKPESPLTCGTHTLRIASRVWLGWGTGLTQIISLLL
mgnify:CR=1 FL=1